MKEIKEIIELTGKFEGMIVVADGRDALVSGLDIDRFMSVIAGGVLVDVFTDCGNTVRVYRINRGEVDKETGKMKYFRRWGYVGVEEYGLNNFIVHDMFNEDGTLVIGRCFNEYDN